MKGAHAVLEPFLKTFLLSERVLFDHAQIRSPGIDLAGDLPALRLRSVPTKAGSLHYPFACCAASPRA
jgi:hypothetical protein